MYYNGFSASVRNYVTGSALKNPHRTAPHEPPNEIMSSPDKPVIHQRLADHQAELANKSLESLFEGSGRASLFSTRAAGLTLDYSKHFCTRDTLDLFEQLAHQVNLKSHIESLFNGDIVNTTEQRPALHTALRGPAPDEEKRREIVVAKERMRLLVDSLQQRSRSGHNGKPISDVVNIGIGGSDLGPRFVVSALQAAAPAAVNVHFVANVDPRELEDTLRPLDPDTTLFITASKSFATLETRANTQAARNWLRDAGCTDLACHFVAVTANVAAAVEFGIAEDNIFPMWDWVGGRYSLWSAIGLPIAIATGWASYEALLDGAEEMDNHFRNAPLTSNMPVLMAMLECWYSDCWQAHSTLVLPYSHALRLFPAYLQQLSMESLGKSVTLDGNAVQRHSGMVIWGEPGTNGQHSFMQLLHQGTRFIPVTFIGVLPQPQDDDRSRHLFANCLSQSRALMTGKSLDQVRAELIAAGLSAQQADAMAPHRCHPGNRPSSTLVLPSLTAHSVGALIALHEHKVFTQSVMWNINAFDQWGVELGKRAASDIFAVLDSDGDTGFDDSTQQLIELYRQNR